MKPKHSILFIFYLLVTIAHAQQQKKNSKQFLEDLVKAREQVTASTNVQPQIDSILNLIKNEKNDTVKIKQFTKIIELCELKDNVKYGQSIVDIADKVLITTVDNSYIRKLLEWRDNGVEYQLAYYNVSFQTKVY